MTHVAEVIMINKKKKKTIDLSVCNLLYTHILHVRWIFSLNVYLDEHDLQFWYTIFPYE